MRAVWSGVDQSKIAGDVAEVFFYECVLVLLNDFYEAPFTEILDSTEFMIKWPMTKVDESMISYLER